MFYDGCDFADKKFIEFITTSDKAKLSLMSGKEVINTYANTLKDSTKSTDNLSSALGTASGSASGFVSSLKSIAADIGISTAIDLAIQAIASAWDELNVTAAEIQGNIDTITSRLGALNAEYEELGSRDPDSLSQSEQDRLQYLDDRIAREERLLEIEQGRKDQELVGHGFTDYFDKDNYNKQFKDSLTGPSMLSNVVDWLDGGSSDSYIGLKINADRSIDSYNEKITTIKNLEDMQKKLNEDSAEYLLLQDQINMAQSSFDTTDMEEQLHTFETYLAEDQTVVDIS